MTALRIIKEETKIHTISKLLNLLNVIFVSVLSFIKLVKEDKRNVDEFEE